MRYSIFCNFNFKFYSLHFVLLAIFVMLRVIDCQLWRRTNGNLVWLHLIVAPVFGAFCSVWTLLFHQISLTKQNKHSIVAYNTIKNPPGFPLPLPFTTIIQTKKKQKPANAQWKHALHTPFILLKSYLNRPDATCKLIHLNLIKSDPCFWFWSVESPPQWPFSLLCHQNSPFLSQLWVAFCIRLRRARRLKSFKTRA